LLSTGPGTIISNNGDIDLGPTERNFGPSSLHLVGLDQQITGNASLTPFYQLFINGGGTKTFSGNVGVANQLNLINGIVSVPTDGAFALTSPSVLNRDVLDGRSYIDGMLLINIGDDGNSAFYPVGNSGTYTPVELTNISGSSPVLGIDANQASVESQEGASPVVLPNQVNDFSINWNWELAFFENNNNSFSAANITIPLLDEDKTQFAGDDYKPIVLYQDRVGVTSNLNNARGDIASRDDVLISAAELGGTGFYFAGKTLVFNPIIHNIITPNGDNTNDYLVIDNLRFFPENEIIIVDRYGVEIYTKSNYISPTSDSAEGEDFTFLPPGNYICILKYNSGENTIKQTISVIK